MAFEGGSERIQPEIIEPELRALVDKLTGVQKSYDLAMQQQRSGRKSINRGCGPGAFTLAKFLVGDSEGAVKATLGKDKGNDGVFCVVFGMMKEDGKWIDHAWVEYTVGKQTLIISPESEVNSSKASFRATVVNSASLEHAYALVGLARLSLADGDIQGMDIDGAQKVVDEINQGKIPVNYEQWYGEVIKKLV